MTDDRETDLERQAKERQEKLRAAVDRGNDAEIARKVYDEAFEEAREAMLQRFRESRPHQAEIHQTLKFYLDVIDDVQERVNGRVHTGKAAWKKLLEMRKRNPLRRMING